MIQVRSEIGRLRRVLVHEPGPEVDRMVPSMMEELLFDDILFGEAAREEHRRLRRLLQLLGVEVVETGELLAETLENPEARNWLLEVLHPGLPPRVRERLAELSPGELARVLVAGIRRDEIDEPCTVDALYALPPIPNWCFQRDPQIVVGEGVVFSAMATPARWREALLARAVFRFHPRLMPAWTVDPLEPEADRTLFLGLHRPRLEGGDLLVLSDDVLAVGLSERTNTVAVELLARALARLEGAPRWLLTIHLPANRAFMHLDTVFTLVDRDAALLHEPVIAGDRPAPVAAIDLHGENLDPSPAGTMLDALADRGIDLEPIPCGGPDPVEQQREQWTDGANAVAVAPGVITLYDRNIRTAGELDRRGFRIVHADDVLLGREEINLSEEHRLCILLSSHEISRARGGPHCLTHPLLRDPA